MSGKRRPPPTIEMPDGAPPPRRRPLLRFTKWLFRWCIVVGLWATAAAILVLALLLAPIATAAALKISAE